MSNSRTAKNRNVSWRRLAVLAGLLLTTLLSACLQRAPVHRVPVVVAADQRLEQQLLSEITIQFLRARGYLIEERRDFASDWMVRRALEAGNVHLVWQETGPVWHNVLGHDQPIRSEGDLFRRVQNEDRLNEIVWLNPLPWSGRMAVVVRRTDATSRGLSTINSLAKHMNTMDPNLVLCVPEVLYDTMRGVRGMERVYGFRFKSDQVQFMSHGASYVALLQGSCDITLGYSKDIAAYDELTTLRDALAFFPASSVAPTAHASLLHEYPEIDRHLSELINELDQTRVAWMEQQIATGQQRPQQLATEFLRETGLVEGR